MSGIKNNSLLNYNLAQGLQLCENDHKSYLVTNKHLLKFIIISNNSSMNEILAMKQQILEDNRLYL